MTDQFHRLLMRVQKPARYVGGEYNQIIKDKKDVDVRVAFCFPDTYEIGMSNIGMRILYGVVRARFCAVGRYGGQDARAWSSTLGAGKPRRGQGF